MPKAITRNTLFYGDNLEILREYIPDESVDLIYLDPPFNSNRSYSVLFKDEKGMDSEAQINAFDDTWHWNERVFRTLISSAPTACGIHAGCDARIHRREPDDGLPGDDGRPPGGTAPGIETDRQPVPALRSDCQPLFESCCWIRFLELKTLK